MVFVYVYIPKYRKGKKYNILYFYITKSIGMFGPASIQTQVACHVALLQQLWYH